MCLRYIGAETPSKMKKIFVITLLFSILASEGLKAQGMPKVDTAGYKFWKNELGMNVAPFACMAMGAYIYDAQYSFSFKRIVKGANALRINAGVQLFVNDRYLYSSPHTPDNYELVSQSSTSEIRRYTESVRKPKLQLGLGYEWRKGNHRLSRFYGADLIVGRSSVQNTKKDYFMVLDSAGTPSSNGPVWVRDPNNTQPSTAFDSRTNSFYLGLAPFYGLRFPITKRLILTAQVGFDMSMAIGNYETEDYANGIHLSGMVTSFDFNMRGISDVTLAYRF